MTKKHKKLLKIILVTITAIFILMNIAIIIQAYSLTHFGQTDIHLQYGYKPNFKESVQIVIFGAKVNKPQVKEYPYSPYETMTIPAGEDKQLGAWLLRTDSVKQGLVIAFHGYMDEKSSMVKDAELLLKMSYDVLLVDFMGAGSSYGVQTTMGPLEAENVKTAYDYAVKEMKEDKIVLLGFSMGAAAILKAQHDYNMELKGMIVEASYDTFQGAINSRLNMLDIPRWPTSAFVTFWISVINGFNGFEANPREYAKRIEVPVLLACGQKDAYISEEVTQAIFDLLPAKNKKLVFYPNSGHESYLKKDKEKWIETVQSFLNNIEKQ